MIHTILRRRRGRLNGRDGDSSHSQYADARIDACPYVGGSVEMRILRGRSASRFQGPIGAVRKASQNRVLVGN